MTMYSASLIFSRREIRSLVLQALCEYDSVGHDAVQVLERILNEREVKGEYEGLLMTLLDKYFRIPQQ